MWRLNVKSLSEKYLYFVHFRSFIHSFYLSETVSRSVTHTHIARILHNWKLYYLKNQENKEKTPKIGLKWNRLQNMQNYCLMMKQKWVVSLIALRV